MLGRKQSREYIRLLLVLGTQLFSLKFYFVFRLDRLAKIKIYVDPTCDQCKQAPATLYHMFWSCPKLLEYWGFVFETFSKIFGKPIAPAMLTATFGVVSQNYNLSRLRRIV